MARGATRGCEEIDAPWGRERNRCWFSLPLFLSTRSLSFFLPFRSYHVSLSLSLDESIISLEVASWSRGRVEVDDCVFGRMDIERMKESCQRGRN